MAGIRNSREGFFEDSERYAIKLDEMDRLVAKLSHEVEADFQKDYYQKYQKYSSNRPANKEIRLDSRFWMSIMKDPNDFRKVEKLIAVNKILYGLSLAYTDAYFNNAPEKVFLERKQAEWEKKHMEMRREGASEDEISRAYSDYSRMIAKSDEYANILTVRNEKRKIYLDQLSRTMVNELTRTLPGLLDAKKAVTMQRPASIPKDQYYSVIIREAVKVAQIIAMTTKTFQGTSLIARQAVKSGVINLQLKKAGKKTSAFIMENENIELIVISNGKEQRYEIISKSADERRASLGEALTEKDESLAETYYEQKYQDIRVGVAKTQEEGKY